MPWAKGQSGNPGGRPAQSRTEVVVAQQRARSRLGIVVARLSTIVRRGTNQDAISAGRLLAQIAGVPLQPAGVAESSPPTDPRHSPDEVREGLRATG